MRRIYKWREAFGDEGCPASAVAFRCNDCVALFRHLREDLFCEGFVKALNIGEIDMGIADVTGAKKNRPRTAKLLVLCSVAVADFQQAVVDELLKTRCSPFIRHISSALVQFDAIFLPDGAG